MVIIDIKGYIKNIENEYCSYGERISICSNVPQR